MSLPAILTSGEMAKLLGWSTRRTTDFLKRHGLALRTSGGCVYTTPILLAEHFPDAARALEAKHDEAGVGMSLEDFGDL